MKSLEKGQDKIQKICDKLRHEIIEPAQIESKTIIDQAHQTAENIIYEAEKQAENLIKQARAQIEQERNVFRSSLQQSAKQVLENLRQEIEQKFFNDELQSVIEQQTSNPKLIAELINGLVSALDKEGLKGDIAAVIPQKVSTQEVNTLLLEEVKKKLKNGALEIGHFSGGAQVKLVGKKMTLDLTDQALREMLANFARKDFRQLIFSN